MKFDIQRLRNLTTSKLHTNMEHVYLDLESLSGETGLMTHMLPRVCRACLPWLHKHLRDARFWNGEYDPSHTGEIELPEPTDADRKEMRDGYIAQPDPLAGKPVIVIRSERA